MNRSLSTGLLLGMLALCGCESITPEGIHVSKRGLGVSFDNDRMLVEPERVAEHAIFSYPSLRRIEEVPAQIIFDNSIEHAVVTKRMLWGTSQTVATVPVGNLLKNQFLSCVSSYFHPLAGDQLPTIRIKVEVLGVVITKVDSRISSLVTMSIQVEDIAKKQICHEKTYMGKSLLPWDGGNLVPDSVYKSVQDCASSFLKDISENHTLIAWLENISPDAASVKKPNFAVFELTPKDQDGVIRGVCSVKCNDWHEGRTATWLRAQLERRCENQLGVEPSRVRVVYDSSGFDAAERIWKVSFSAFARSEMVLNYDPTTKSGTCVADMGLMGLTAEKASEKLKDYVMAEMDRRSGVVSSGKTQTKAQVRFDAFKTDQRYNLIHCPFRVVY